MVVVVSPCNQHPVGTLLRQDQAHTRDYAGRYSGRRLHVLHEVEIALRPDMEEVKYLVEHFLMLGGHADPALIWRG